MASSANSAVSSEAASFPEKPASMTRFKPCPSTSTQPAATTSATPATAIRARYGQRKRSTRASWRMSRLGGRSGMLSICRATSVQPFFECRNPVPYRQAGTGSEVHLAADIGGGGQVPPPRGRRREVFSLWLLGQIPVEKGISFPPTAAQKPLREPGQVETRPCGEAPRHRLDVL